MNTRSLLLATLIAVGWLPVPRRKSRLRPGPLRSSMPPRKPPRRLKRLPNEAAEAAKETGKGIPPTPPRRLARRRSMRPGRREGSPWLPPRKRPRGQEAGKSCCRYRRCRQRKPPTRRRLRSASKHPPAVTKPRPARPGFFCPTLPWPSNPPPSSAPPSTSPTSTGAILPNMGSPRPGIRPRPTSG